MSVATKNGPVSAEWQTLDTERQTMLDQSRQIAALTEPLVLPPKHQRPDRDLPNPYQSLGPRGAINITGALTMYLFPSEYPWAKFTLAPEYLYSGADPGKISMAQDMLLLADLTTHDLFEASMRDYTRPIGFRSNKYKSLMQLVVGGDVLEMVDHGIDKNGNEGDDFRMRFFRQDRYVTQRDCTGAPVLHITHESVDVATLSDDDFAKTKIDGDVRKSKNRSERMYPVYTHIEYQPFSRDWVVKQEINGEEVRVREDEYSRYFCTPYRLVGEENYGRGFFSAFEGDLRSLEHLREALLDFAVTASKHLLFLDQASELRAEDFARATGSVIEGARIVGGQVQDAAFFRAEKMPDFQVVQAVHEAIRNDIGAAVMIRSEAVRKSERTTAYEIAQTVIREMEGGMSGLMSEIADYQQVPLFHYARHWLQKKNKLAKPVDEMFKRKMVEVQALTGVAALARTSRAENLLGTLERVGRVAPEALAPLNQDEVLRYLLRAANFYEPNLIKTPEQVEAERQRALQTQAAMTAIETTGRVIEKGAPQGQPVAA